MSFNFEGIRDNINFDSPNYYAVFVQLGGNVNFASDLLIETSEVLTIPRVLVEYTSTTNQITKQKILSIPTITVESGVESSFNTIVLASTTGGNGDSFNFIVGKYQTFNTKVSPNNPVRIILNRILLNFD